MKTALMIHSYAGATENVARHWPYYKKSGWDLFGISRENTTCIWPEPIPTKAIGRDQYIGGDNLPRRLVDTFRWFVEDPGFANYTHACVIEHDGIFLRPPPDDPTITVAAHQAGHQSPPMKALRFYHCPWWMDREHARMFVVKGDELLAAGDYELGNPDFFFGYVWQCIGIPVQHLEGTFSRNSFDIPEDRIMARDRIREGKLWFVHGSKSAEQLSELLS